MSAVARGERAAGGDGRTEYTGAAGRGDGRPETPPRGVASGGGSGSSGSSALPKPRHKVKRHASGIENGRPQSASRSRAKRRARKRPSSAKPAGSGASRKPAVTEAAAGAGAEDKPARLRPKSAKAASRTRAKSVKDRQRAATLELMMRELARLDDADTAALATTALRGVMDEMTTDKMSLFVGSMVKVPLTSATARRHLAELLSYMMEKAGRCAARHQSRLITFLLANVTDSNARARDAFCTAFGDMITFVWPRTVAGKKRELTLYLDKLSACLATQDSVSQVGATMALRQLVFSAPKQALLASLPRLMTMLRARLSSVNAATRPPAVEAMVALSDKLPREVAKQVEPLMEGLLRMLEEKPKRYQDCIVLLVAVAGLCRALDNQGFLEPMRDILMDAVAPYKSHKVGKVRSAAAEAVAAVQLLDVWEDPGDVESDSEEEEEEDEAEEDEDVEDDEGIFTPPPELPVEGLLRPKRRVEAIEIVDDETVVAEETAEEVKKEEQRQSKPAAKMHAPADAAGDEPPLSFAAEDAAAGDEAAAPVHAGAAGAAGIGGIGAGAAPTAAAGPASAAPEVADEAEESVDESAFDASAPASPPSPKRPPAPVSSLAAAAPPLRSRKKNTKKKRSRRRKSEEELEADVAAAERMAEARRAAARPVSASRRRPGSASRRTPARVSSPTGRARSPGIRARSPTKRSSSPSVSIQLRKIIKQQQRMMKDMAELKEFTYSRMQNLDRRLKTIEDHFLPSLPRKPATLPAGAATASVRASLPTLPSSGSGSASSKSLGAGVWTSVLDQLATGDLDAAYGLVLQTADELQLVRLMNRTGPVLDRLHPDVQHPLLWAIVAFVKADNFIDQVLPWLHNAVGIGLHMRIPRALHSSLTSALHTLAASPTHHGVGAAGLLRHFAPGGMAT